jgi:hypothetical protein
MALADQAVLAVNPEWIPKVKMAMVKIALQIKGETQQRGFVSYYTKRSYLADVILGAPISNSISPQAYNPNAMTLETAVARFSWAVASSVAINWDSTDGDLEFTVTAVWDDIAGVDADEAPDPV